MGYMRHHAIVVTGMLETHGAMLSIHAAWDRAAEIFPHISSVVESEINGYGSFFVPPDGSKEGWAESGEGDERRTVFIEWLRSTTYEDGSSPLKWVEIQYGDDERETIVTAHSDDPETRGDDEATPA